MRHRRFLAVLPALLLVSTMALAAPAKQFRSFKGTWMCPTCYAMKQPDTPENCEAKGHKHALRLDDGAWITFADNARAAALIHGGGRDKAKIEVYGLYDPDSHSIDVDAYKIDEAWSTWCDVHSRMDFCRSTGEPDEAQGTSAKSN